MFLFGKEVVVLEATQVSLVAVLYQVVAVVLVLMPYLAVLYLPVVVLAVEQFLCQVLALTDGLVL